ncbi:uncharacterized protein ISCGN_031873 [Ixodes scapularis]
MAFAIVEFINKRLVEVVPSSWINGSMCFWPPGKPERINKLVRASAKTQEDWKQHAVEIKEVFSSYERARKKLEKSQFTSDLASTDEEVQRRPVQRPRRFISDSDSDGSPPKKKAKKASNRALTVHQLYPALPEDFPSPLASVFQKQVLRHLQVMRLMLEQNRELLEALQAGNMRSEAIVPSLLPEPFNDMQEFTSFDETIQEATRDQLIANLKSFGGDNVSCNTRRVLEYLMTDNVAQNYSWIGNKGKKKFCELKVKQIITGCTELKSSQIAKPQVVKPKLSSPSCQAQVAKPKSPSPRQAQVAKPKSPSPSRQDQVAKPVAKKAASFFHVLYFMYYILNLI